MNYVEDARYYRFLIESTIEAEKLKGFTSTLFAANEGVSLDKLFAIREDVGDKIRNLWDKFIAFINRVWAKFMDYTNRVIQTDKGYLEQYKETILNKQPNDVDIQMRNYAAGIHNMTNLRIPPFIVEQESINVDDDVAFKKKLIPAYKDGNQEWSSWLVAYFQGGEEKAATNLRQLNMTDLYNYCHDYKKVEDAINKDKDVVTKTYNDCQALITKAKTAAKEPPKPATPAQPEAPKPEVKPEAPKPEVKPEAPKPAAATPTGTSANVESAISGYIATYFNEGDGLEIGGKSAPNASANTAVTSGDKTSAANNMKNVQQVQFKMPDGSAAPTAVVDDSVNLDDLTKKITIYNETASGILTAKMTSAHQIYQDYMKLIKLHVGQQVGKDGDGKIAQAGSNHATLKIGDPEGAAKQLEAIDAAEKAGNKEEKSKLIGTLMDQIKSQNPNFNGGIDAIRAALPKK